MAGSSYRRAGPTATWPAWRPTRKDNVYVFNRSEHPVIIYDQEGKFLDSWGDKQMFPRPHGITIVDDIIYLADDSDHTVRKMHPGRQGPDDARHVGPAVRHRLPLERARQPDHHRARRPARSTARPASRWPRTATSTSRTATATPRIHRFTSDGKLIAVLGRPGLRPRPVHAAALGLGAHQRRDLGLRPRERPHPDLQPDRRAAPDLDQRPPPRRPVHPAGQHRRRRRDVLGEGRDQPGRQGLAGRPTTPRSSIRDMRRQRAGEVGREGPVRPRRLLLAARPLGRLEGQHLRRRGHPHRAQPVRPLARELSLDRQVRPRSNAQPRPVPPLPLGEGGRSRVFPVRATISFGIHRGRAPDDDRRRGHVPLRGQADWEQLPQGWVHGDVAGIATDSQDRVYVFNR